MRKSAFIPVRVDEDDYVELTFEEFEEIVYNIYDAGFEDGRKSVTVTENPWWDNQWWKNPVVNPVSYDTTTPPSSTCSVSVAPSSVSFSSSDSKDNGTTTYKYDTPPGCLTFGECIDFLKNR